MNKICRQKFSRTTGKTVVIYKRQRKRNRKGNAMTCWGIKVRGFVIHDSKLDKTFELSEQDYETYCTKNRSRIVSEGLWFSDDKLHARFGM